MAGENPELDMNLDPDYDGAGSGTFVDPAELHMLIEALDEKGSGGYAGTEGREDWALERECEITRLEQENEELRRLLGVDPDSMAASGVTLDLDRVESGRFSTFLSSSSRRTGGHSQQGSGDGWQSRPSYWDGNGGHQYSPQHAGQHAGGAPLQRAMELQPGMRMGMQGRRPGIFGAGQQRGGFVGGGRGGPPGNPMWSNPQMVSTVVERPWQSQGNSALDLSR